LLKKMKSVASETISFDKGTNELYIRNDTKLCTAFRTGLQKGKYKSL